MRISRVLVAAILAGSTLAGASRAQEPLSAIDWLSQSVTAAPPALTLPQEPAITSGSALPANVSVSVLGGTSPDGVGLLPAQVTGLPRSLWGLGRTDAIISALFAEDLVGLPALQGLLITLLLAEAEPPTDAGNTGRLLVARLDRLLSIGALDQAEALLEAADATTSPELFRRSFDVALLTGSEDRACEAMRQNPGLAPTFPARIFCLARSGDWNAAALTLRTAQVLGQIGPEDDALLSRYLDPDLYEGEPMPAAAKPVTPLSWRMFEAVGETLPTGPLPLAFAHAELRETAGWKAQIEAAERLARAGAIPPNVLLGLYTQSMPAASGGVWDRADAFQGFDQALARRDPQAVSRELPLVWDQMRKMELEVPFAALFAQRLAALPLTDTAAKLAFEIGLLSPDYQRIARTPVTDDVRERFLAGLASGKLAGLVAPDSMARAIAPAFVDAPVAAEAQLMLDDGRVGEAILWSMGRIAKGVQGDLRGVTEGLALLRAAGMEDVARRTALELMLLERRG